CCDAEPRAAPIKDQRRHKVGDLGVNPIAAPTPPKPSPNIDPSGTLAGPPQIPPPADACITVQEVFAKEPRYVPEPWGDLGKMLEAFLASNRRREGVLHDGGNHLPSPSVVGGKGAALR